ncbi:unnamed protein product [Lota lota]
MSLYEFQKAINSTHRVSTRSDVTGGGHYKSLRSEAGQGGGNGYGPADPYMDAYPYTLSSGGGAAGYVQGGSGLHQKTMILQEQCQDFLRKAEHTMQTGGQAGDVECYMSMARETIDQLKACASHLQQIGQPNDNVVRSVEVCRDQLMGLHMAVSETLHRRRKSTRGNSGGWEDPGRSFMDAMAWIGQQKRLIETSPWGDDPETLKQQLVKHQKFHSTIQRSEEVDRAKDDLLKNADKAGLNALNQEWDSLQKMSFSRSEWLQELHQIIEDISREIMWVNYREEEELVFDWGDRDIDLYIPKKQESYSQLMSDLEEKERDLNRLKLKVDVALKNNHPASDKIQAYMDTLQTQWSWLLQITKCIHVHLKENAAYSQFFKEANETYSTLQKEHETIRRKFTCDKNTSLESLLELLTGLEKEQEKILENKQQVQRLVSTSKSIVRLKPRNPEEKSSTTVIVRALCDFKQDQKVICKDNEGILKDNSQRSKWQVTGPGGLDMLVPSVCLLVPPPNPLTVSMAKKNDQYYEAILSIWNQLYINIKSLISWQYCRIDIERINSLTIAMLSRMSSEEYRSLIKCLETHYAEFRVNSHGSQIIEEEDMMSMENQYNGAQTHYEQLVVQLPSYSQYASTDYGTQQKTFEINHLMKSLSILLSVIMARGSKTQKQHLTELRTLKTRIESVEGALNQHIHICLGEDKVRECGIRITELETVQRDIDNIQGDILRIKDIIQVEGMEDSDKAQFLHSEIGGITQKLSLLDSSLSAYLQRLRALRDLLESVSRGEDIVKVHEARLTEKDTTSLLPGEVEDYILDLKKMKVELDQKRDVFASMEAEMEKANHWNTQVGDSSLRCDMTLAKYSEQVGQLTDRWRRIHIQIDCRLKDLEFYVPQLQQYKNNSTSLNEWISSTQKRQKALQSTKIEDLQALNLHISQQKALNSEIKEKRGTLDSVLTESGVCVSSIKDYESDLASYGSGLETLLNIPIKRTIVKSPSTELNQEAVEMQTRYMELFTLSGDYYTYLGAMQKNMEELKIRNTRIDFLEEELRLLKGNIEGHTTKNRELQDALSHYQLELSNSKAQLLSVEEVKRRTTMQCNATQENLDSTQSQLSSLREQLERLKNENEDESRKRRLAEDRYNKQKETYEILLIKMKKEEQDANWAKTEAEKNMTDKEREAEQLRRRLTDESARVRDLQLEISKNSNRSSLDYKNLVTELSTEREKLKLEIEKTQKQSIETTEALDRIKLSLESECHIKQRLQEENDRLKNEFRFWKDKYDSKESQTKQYDSDKDHFEQEKNVLKGEIQRLRKELEDIEGTYKNRSVVFCHEQTDLSEVTIGRRTMETELKTVREPPTLDPLTLLFDGVRKPVTAKQLHDCGVLDEPTFNKLLKGKKSVPEVSVDKKVILKGTGPIAGLVIASPKGTFSLSGPLSKMSLSEAKKENLLPLDYCADLLLDAQAATGHIIDPRTNQKLTVEEACNHGLVDENDRDRLLAAEAAAIGYYDRSTSKPLSVFDAMKKGLVDKKTALTLLQAQESAGGILDPVSSVFLTKDTAIKRNLLDEDLNRALNQQPECYIDPETEKGVTYESLKGRCKTESHTGLILLPISAKQDPNKLLFDGVRKPVTAQQLLDCGVLDKPTFNQLLMKEKTIPDVSTDKKVILKGTGAIAAVIAGDQGKMSFAEAKKQGLLRTDIANKLLEAQAATGHIIDPETNRKLTVVEACDNGVVAKEDREWLLAAECAAIGYTDRSTAKPLSVFEAMKKGIVDKKTALTLLQAQESAGGILDPVNSIFLPRDIAIKRKLIDEELKRSLNQQPECYVDPDTENDVTYESLKRRCKTEYDTGLLLLPISEKQDPNKLIFDGVRKPVTAQQLLDCEVLDKPTFNQLLKKEKTITEVSTVNKVSLKGTGAIAAVLAGHQGKMSFAEAKKQGLIPIDSANKLLEAQAATGHIIDPETNRKLTVVEACDNGVVAKEDREWLLAAECAAIGYTDRSTAKPLSVFEAMKKGIVDKKTALTLLQAQESAGGILDPVNSIFLPRDIAIKRKLIDEELKRSLNQQPECYVDPDTENDVTYESLKRRCKTEYDTGLLLLPISEKQDPNKLIFDGVRKPVTAKQLLDCEVLDKPTFNQLLTGKKTVLEVSRNKKYNFKGTKPIAGVIAGNQGKMSFAEAKTKGLLLEDCANILLEAQAATGHIIDPRTNQKLTVNEACDKGVVAREDRDRLLAAESAAIGYIHQSTAKPLSVFEAMKKGIVDKKTALILLQAQESAGGILDPVNSVYLSKDTAIKHNLLDEELNRALNQKPECYIDPDTEKGVTYESLKRRCKTESETHTSLILLPISEQQDPTKLFFDGIRKTVTAQQLLDCGVLDKKTFTLLVEGKKTVSDVSVDKKLHLKGTGSIGGIAAGPLGKMSFTEARNGKIISSDSANFLLDAQAATGYIIDPRTDQKLTVEEAYSKGVIDPNDRVRLLAVEAAALGYQDPNTSNILTASQAMRKGLIDKDTALRILQAQESVGGILDPFLGVFLPRDIAMDRNLIDKELYNDLDSSPECFLDPDTQHRTNYVSLKKKSKLNPSTGLLLLPAPEKPLTVQGLRGQVSLTDLVDANLLEHSDVDNLRVGKLTSQDIEQRLQSYLRGSTCIAGVYDETSNKVMPIYKAMEEGLLPPGTTLELLEAQAASGFVVDPVKNIHLTVTDAFNQGLVGPEFKDKLLSAERAVTGYKLPGSDKVMSIFETMERGLLERGLGIRLLEAQLASGGIIDPIHSHRIDVNVAYKRGYFNAAMNQILTDGGEDTKGFCDPNTDDKLTYMELKQRCIADENTGLILLPILDKKAQQQSTQKNTQRKRRVIIVDPDNNREMTVREAFDKGLIDYNTYIELSMHECEWEEITTTSPDGSSRLLIVDRKTGKQYNISELLEQGVIDQSMYERYTSHSITLTEFADVITRKNKKGFSTSSSSSSLLNEGNSGSTATSAQWSSFSTRPLSPLSSNFGKCTTTRTTTVTGSSSIVSREVLTSAETLKLLSSVSITVTSPDEAMSEQEPVGAIFDTDNLEKIPILEARNRGIVDSITAQRMLEAQACTGGIIDPSNGLKHGIQEACCLGLIDDKMVPLLKSAQKAYVGFENLKIKNKLSAAEAMKEKWLPYEAGQRFMEYQFVTGGLFDPELGCRRTIEDALNIGWLDGSTARKLQDTKRHSRNLTCPKTKLKISYKEALDNCLLEETTGVRMLQASTISSRGISSPYSVSSAPGSSTGSRSSSQKSSRRSSVDLGAPTSSVSKQNSSTSYSLSSFSSSSTQ